MRTLVLERLAEERHYLVEFVPVKNSPVRTETIAILRDPNRRYLRDRLKTGLRSKDTNNLNRLLDDLIDGPPTMYGDKIHRAVADGKAPFGLQPELVYRADGFQPGAGDSFTFQIKHYDDIGEFTGTLLTPCCSWPVVPPRERRARRSEFHAPSRRELRQTFSRFFRFFASRDRRLEVRRRRVSASTIFLPLFHPS